VASGRWCCFGEPGDYPGNQREDDEASVCFDSDPLETPLDVLGSPVLRLDLTTDRTPTQVVARLCDVAPDGTSSRVTYGALDLSASGGPAPGCQRTVRLALEPAGWTVSRGHRLRLALSTSYWPLIWPSPEDAAIAVRLGTSRMQLPVRSPAEPELPVAMPPPEAAAEPAMTDLAAGIACRHVAATGSTREPIDLEIAHGRDAGGAVALTRYDEIGVSVGHAVTERYRIHRRDPLTARAEVCHHRVMAGERWRAEVLVECRLRADGDAFELTAELRALLDGKPFAARAWRETIPRQPAPPRSRMLPMSEPSLAQLKAREIHLLQRRTDILNEQQSLVDHDSWNQERADELSRDQDEVETELAEVRRQLMEAGD
jgi:hypothetical protein